MATINIDNVIPEQQLEVNIGVLTFNLATKMMTVRITTSDKPREEVLVDMSVPYEALTQDQKDTVMAWCKYPIAEANNIVFGTALTIADIPNTIFDDEPVPPPEEPLP